GREKEKEAKQVLEIKAGDAAVGSPALPRVERIKYEEAAADLRQHYATTGSRNMGEAEKRLKHLDAFFRGHNRVGTGGAEAPRYVRRRRARRGAKARINRELAILTKRRRRAYENRKLLRMPVIRKLKEAGPRQGFLERGQFVAVRQNLP